MPLHRGDCLAELTDYVADYSDWTDGSYYDSVKPIVTVQNEVYGIPFATSEIGLWYNKSIMKQAGLSENFEPKNGGEFFAALEAIKQNCPDVLPFWCDPEYPKRLYETALYAAESGYMKQKEEKWIAKSTGHLKMFEFMGRIYGEKLLPPLEEPMESNTAIENFKKGKLGVCLDTHDFGNIFQVNRTHLWPKFTEEVGFAPFPTNDGQTQGTVTTGFSSTIQMFTISENSKHKKEAFDFIKHCMKSENYEDAIIGLNGMSVRRDVAQSGKYSSRPFKKQQAELMGNMKFQFVQSSFRQAEDCLTNMVNSVITGSRTPQEAMGEYAKQVPFFAGQDNWVEEP